MSPIDRYREILEQSGRRMTRERRAIVETALGFLRTFTVDELMEELRRNDRGVGRATVFRTLQHLVYTKFLCRFSRLDTYLPLTGRITW